MQAELSVLKATAADSDIEAQINALDPEDFDSKKEYDATVGKLLANMARAPSKRRVSAKIERKSREIKRTRAKIEGYRAERENAWKNLTGSRNLSSAATAVLRKKLEQH